MISKKFNLNGSSMGAGYWGEKPKKKPINKLDPNRIDENDETKESYKMNNMITSSRSDENIYSVNKLKRKAPIGSSKSDENDHSYLIKEKELQEKRKRRIPLFKNEQEPINFLAEPIKLVHHVDPIAKPPLDFNSIKKSLSNKVDPILLNPSNLTYRLEPPNQTYRIENEIIPKNNSNNKHFKTDNEAQSNGTDFIHRIKSEEKNLNKISDSPKIKLFETVNNNKKKSTPTRIDSTQIQGVEEYEILNLNILPQNETNQNGEKIKIASFKEEQGKVMALYNKGMFFASIDIDGLEAGKPEFRPGVNMGGSFEKMKSSLEEIIRETISEYFDGRDNLIDPLAAEEENN
jgi:hypothetical protein